MSTAKPKGKSKEKDEKPKDSSKEHSKDQTKDPKKGKKEPQQAAPLKIESHNRILEDKDGNFQKI